MEHLSAIVLIILKLFVYWSTEVSTGTPEHFGLPGDPLAPSSDGFWPLIRTFDPYEKAFDTGAQKVLWTWCVCVLVFIPFKAPRWLKPCCSSFQVLRERASEDMMLFFSNPTKD